MTEEALRFQQKGEEYLRNANECFARNELEKGAELVWGYVCQNLKAAGALVGMTTGSHRQLVDFVRMLSRETGNPYWKDTFLRLNDLHVTFYESHLDLLQVRERYRQAMEFVQRLRSLEERFPTSDPSSQAPPG